MRYCLPADFNFSINPVNCNRFNTALTRRDMLRASACGFGSLALAGLSQADANQPHFAPRAKRIIFLFMWGGPSHVDLSLIPSRNLIGVPANSLMARTSADPESWGHCWDHPSDLPNTDKAVFG